MVLLLIDGLTAAGDPPMGELCPVLERLAARGRGGRVVWYPGSEAPEGERFAFTLFGLDLALDRDAPLGYYTALTGADDTALARADLPDPGHSHTWACLGFTHLRRKKDDLVFLSPERTGQTPDELWALARSLAPDWQRDGWSLRTGGDGLPLLSNPQALSARTLPLAALEGRSARENLFQGPGAGALHRLLITGQLHLARHPGNAAREAAGRLTLNSPWFWGVAAGPALATALSVPAGRCWSGSAALRGVARQRGWVAQPLDEIDGMAELDDTLLTRAIAGGPVVIHLRAPALLARHGLTEQRRRRLRDLSGAVDRWAAALAGSGRTLAVAGSYALDARGWGVAGEPAPWVAARGRHLTARRRFWQGRHWGAGPVMTGAEWAGTWWQ